VVGGAAVLTGPMVGGVFVVMLPFLLEELADFAFILKGAVLILVLIFAPAGIVELIGRPFRRRRERAVLEAGGSIDVTGNPDAASVPAAEASAPEGSR